MASYVKVREKQINSSLHGWTCKAEVLQFVDLDTRWKMEDSITWRSPSSDQTLVETLGRVISDAYWKHKNGNRNEAGAERSKGKEAK